MVIALDVGDACTGSGFAAVTLRACVTVIAGGAIVGSCAFGCLGVAAVVGARVFVVTHQRLAGNAPTILTGVGLAAAIAVVAGLAVASWLAGALACNASIVGTRVLVVAFAVSFARASRDVTTAFA